MNLTIIVAASEITALINMIEFISTVFGLFHCVRYDWRSYLNSLFNVWYANIIMY